jgi:Mrp family chromosome partitioning ATPase
MAPVVDGVLIMAKYGAAERDNARRTIELLNKVEANILGLIINNLELAKRYGYYHYYYYSPEEGVEGPPVKQRRKWSTSKEPKNKKPPPME